MVSPIAQEARMDLIDECAAIVAAYGLTRVDMRRAALRATRQAHARRPDRSMRQDCRFLVDVLMALQAIAKRRVH